MANREDPVLPPKPKRSGIMRPGPNLAKLPYMYADRGNVMCVYTGSCRSSQFADAIRTVIA